MFIYSYLLCISLFYVVKYYIFAPTKQQTFVSTKVVTKKQINK